MGDITGSPACSVISNNDGYYIFYPHSRDINGMPCETGTAILFHFSTCIDCVRYVMWIPPQLTAHQFTLTFVDISVINKLHISTISADTCNNDNCVPWWKERKTTTNSHKSRNDIVHTVNLGSVHSLQSNDHVTGDHTQEHTKQSRNKYEAETPWDYAIRKHRHANLMACKHAQYTPEKQKDVQKRKAKRRITLLAEQDNYDYTRTEELNKRMKSQKHSQYTPEQEMTIWQDDTKKKILLVLTKKNMQKKLEIPTPEKLTNNIK